MNLFDLIEEHFRRRTPQDIERFRKLCLGIDPSSGPGVYSSGPHCIKAFEAFLEFLKRSNLRGNILEIGFNSGVSSAIMLGIGFASVTSVEIENTEAVHRGEDILRKEYGDRFKLIFCNSEFSLPILKDAKFDSAYIDGDHSMAATVQDLDLCTLLGINVVLMDDWLPKFGTALEAVHYCGWTTQLMIGNFLIATKTP